MTSPDGPNALACACRSIRPMIAVTDLARTIRFYVEKLGFNCNAMFGEPPVWCDLDLDGQSMMFNQPAAEATRRDVPRSSKDYTILYVTVAGVEALHGEYRRRGLGVTDLRVTGYGMKEFELRDPDDNWLWFGEASDDPATVKE